MKTRYRAGRKSCENAKIIDELITKGSGFTWTDAPKATGRVNSKSAPSTTSTPSFSSSGGDVFKSRDKPFNDALKLLQQDDNKIQVIALCGMGGVGKTTMMEQLKMVANDKKMFNWIVKVVIGRDPNMLSIQNDIAVSLGGEGLPEAIETSRAESLCRRFNEILKDNKTKILVILDDLWKKIELKNIGLTAPLPSGVTLLLTSRDSKICQQIAAEAHSSFQVVGVDVLEEAEARDFFCQSTGVSEEYNRDMYRIGCEIVKKCGYLPLAIKLIGTTLKCQEKFVWRSALQRLIKNNINADVQEIIKISYEHREEEDKEIFLLCGLFPEDYDIPIEYLTRYAWGLKLFKEVSTLRDARDMTKTCVQNLLSANLLLHGDDLGCVRMHDLMLAFVFDRVSKGSNPWIVKHGDISKLGGDEMSKSCKRISLTCKGMSEFPADFKYPNLTFIQLMHGDLKFSDDFYENMEKLEVMAYFNMEYPMLPRSFQCSINLKSLCLYGCKLMFDCSFVGDLVNLEVLSFAYCRIHKLPSAIGNLKKLKLLDLTGCVDLHIDDAVFRNLENLEELYMRVSYRLKAIGLAISNWEDLKMLSSKLYALEVEFPEEMAQLKNMYFNKLDKFKISIGRMLETEDNDERNTLMLKTDRSSDLLDFQINGLLKKTEILHLEVMDMIGFEDVVSIHSYDQHSFNNLRELNVSNCDNMKFLFPISVASGLRKLERLEISSCSIMEALVYNDGCEISSGAEIIKFEELKFLSLKRLPKLVSFSIYPDKNNMSVLLNSQVKVPKLEKLTINNVERLEEVWCSSDEEANNISMLRVIKVKKCDSLVNLFPINPMRVLNHLETLTVKKCGSIEVIFNIDLGYVGHEVGQLSSSSLRSIKLSKLKKVREVWRIKGGENSSSLYIRGFEAVERIKIEHCERFRNLFTPTNAKLDMRAVVDIHIECGDEDEVGEEIEILSRNEADDNITGVEFSSNQIHTFGYLRNLQIIRHNSVEVVFEIDSSTEPVTITNNQQPLLPNLQCLYLGEMKRMSHVWKCSNWNKFLNHQKQDSFRNLTTIEISECNRIKYLFSPVMVKLLSNLKTINIWKCDGMEEVVSNRDDEDEEITACTTFFPHLHLLKLDLLENLKRIGGGGDAKNTTSLDQSKVSQIDGVSWSLCQFSREIHISNCDELSSVVPSYAVGQMQKLQVLKVLACRSLMNVFETQVINNSSNCGNRTSSTNTGEGNGGMNPTLTTLAISNQKNISVPQLSNLQKLEITECDLLQHVFTFSTLESLVKLEELMIRECKAMKMIVKEENREQAMKSIPMVFPRLKSLELLSLPNLEGFFLGMTDFHWPLLEKVTIRGCPQMTVFTSGWSSTPKLKYIHTILGKHSLDECGLNFHMMTNLHQTRLESSGSTSFESLPWSFHNLIEIGMEPTPWSSGISSKIKTIIPSSELLQLQKLERIRVYGYSDAVEVFDEPHDTVVEIPNLRQVKLHRLPNLKYIWKSNHHGRTLLEFPNLTELTIAECSELEHVFTGSMVGSLLQLQELHVSYCQNMEVLIRVEKESEFEVLKFANLRHVKLNYLSNLKYIWKSNHHGRTLLELPNLTELTIDDCDELEHVFTGSMVGSLLQLQELHVSDCRNMEVLVRVEKESELEVLKFANLRQVELKHLRNLKYIWEGSHHGTALLSPNLTTLSINHCDSLKHVFTGSMVGSLQQLQDLNISLCKKLEVIVRVEDEEESEIECDAKVKDIIVLPKLKSLKLVRLGSLEGFCLGKDDFSCPSLHTLEIIECPKVTAFTNGRVATPTLKIDTGLGRCYVVEDLNSFIRTGRHEGLFDDPYGFPW